jgi:hypothetical protein
MILRQAAGLSRRLFSCELTFDDQAVRKVTLAVCIMHLVEEESQSE